MITDKIKVGSAFQGATAAASYGNCGVALRRALLHKPPARIIKQKSSTNQCGSAFQSATAAKSNGNWRVTFEFEGPDDVDVDYEDYH